VRPDIRLHVGLDSLKFEAHPLRQTKANLIHQRTGNLHGHAAGRGNRWGAAYNDIHYSLKNLVGPSTKSFFRRGEDDK